VIQTVDTWLCSKHWMQGLSVRWSPAVRSVTLCSAQWKRPTTLFVWGAYKYVLAGLRLTLLVFLTTRHLCEPKQTLSTHLLHRLTIFVRLRMIQVHLLEWLHLVALGDCFGCDFLVTLGGCRHIDGLEQRRSIDTSWWLFVAISQWLWGGFVPSLAESRKVTLMDCSCYWDTSHVSRFLRCPSEDEVPATPLSRRTTKCWLTQWGRSVPASTWTSGEKSASQLCLIDIYSPCDWLFIYCWLVHPLCSGINISSSPFTYGKVV